MSKPPAIRPASPLERSAYTYTDIHHHIATPSLTSNMHFHVRTNMHTLHTKIKARSVGSVLTSMIDATDVEIAQAALFVNIHPLTFLSTRTRTHTHAHARTRAHTRTHAHKHTHMHTHTRTRTCRSSSHVSRSLSSAWNFSSELIFRLDPSATATMVSCGYDNC
jgi:hypothetical protein